MGQSAVKQRMEIKARKKGFFKSKLLQSFRGAAPEGEKNDAKDSRKSPCSRLCNVIFS